MPDPNAEFRAELANLRSALVRSIQSNSTADIDAGLRLYRRLLSHVLDRFRTLYREGRPNYQPVLFSSSASGQEVRWIAEDYREFIGQAMESSSGRSLHSVIGGLVGCVMESVEAGDQGALRVFLDFLVWIASQLQIGTLANSQLNPPTFGDVLRPMDSLLGVTISVSRRSEDSLALVPLTAEFVRAYSELMKVSIDNVAASDLEAASGSLIRGLQTYSDLGFYGHQGAEGEAIWQLQAGALVGVDGWILYGSEHGTATATSSELRSALRSVYREINSWNALYFVTQIGPDEFFGWNRWELFRDLRPQGATTLSMSMYVRTALLLEAIETDTRPTMADILRGAASDASPSTKKNIVEALIRDLDSLNAERWGWTGFNQDASDGLRQEIAQILTSLSAQATDQLIGLSLSLAGVSRFREAVLATRADQLRLVDLLEPREGPALPPGTAVGESDISQFLTFGINELVAKEYFVESDVEADPSFLAHQVSVSQARSENSHVLAQLEQRLPASVGDWKFVESSVRKAIRQLKRRSRSPIVVAIGPWSFVRQFEDAGALVPETFSSRPGSFDGCPFYRLTSVRESKCLVFDSRALGQVAWRQVSPYPEEIFVDRDRLLLGVRLITEDVAQELLDLNPELGRRPMPDGSVESGTRRLQLDVQVRVLEQFALPGPPESVGGWIYQLRPDEPVSS